MADTGAFSKLLQKKGSDSSMNPAYKNSKMKVLQNLHDEMSKMMGGDLGSSLKKVTVAAPDKAGLAAGLAHAKDMMSSGDDAGAADHEHEADDSEPSEDDMASALSAGDSDTGNDEAEEDSAPHEGDQEDPADEAAEADAMSVDELESKIQQYTDALAKKAQQK